MTTAAAALALLACRPRAAAPPPETFPPPLLAGPVEERLVGGTYRDDVAGFSVDLPEGWVGAVPAHPEHRLRLTQVATGATVDLWLRPSDEPTSRPDCAWAFDDVGPYGGLPVSGEARVGTCQPTAAGSPRVQVLIVRRGGEWLHAETALPDGQLLEAWKGAQEVLSGVRLDR